MALSMPLPDRVRPPWMRRPANTGWRRHAVVLPIVIVLALACCAPSAHARPRPMQYGYQQGDAFRTDRSVSIHYDNVRTDDRGRTRVTHYTSVDRYRYTQVVSSVGPGGLAEKVTRSYEVATTSRPTDGSKIHTAARRLQGRTFTSTREADTVRVAPEDNLLAEDLRELHEALSDEYAAALPNAERQVGDSWPLPVWAARQFYVTSEAAGTCRFQEITRYRGKPCARIGVQGEVAAMDLDGRHIRLHLTGALLWSQEIGRVVAFTLEAASESQFTTTQGATVVTDRTTGRLSLHQVYHWRALAGKPNATP